MRLSSTLLPELLWADRLTCTALTAIFHGPTLPLLHFIVKALLQCIVCMCVSVCVQRGRGQN